MLFSRKQEGSMYSAAEIPNTCATIPASGSIYKKINDVCELNTCSLRCCHAGVRIVALATYIPLVFWKVLYP